MVNYLLNLIRRGYGLAPADIRPVINPSFPPILKAAPSPAQGIGDTEVSGKYWADNAGENPGQTTAPKLLALPAKRPDGISYTVSDSKARHVRPIIRNAGNPDPDGMEKAQEGRAPGFPKMQQRSKAEQSANETPPRIGAWPDDKLGDEPGQKPSGTTAQANRNQACRNAWQGGSQGQFLANG
jgi:hypothetical protein